MRLQDVAAVQVDLSGEICRWGRRRVSVGVKADGVDAFAAIIEGIKLHGDALRNPLVAERAPDATERVEPHVLNREGESVGCIRAGRSDLKAEVTREALNVHGRRAPNRMSLEVATVGEQQRSALESDGAIAIGVESQARGARKSVRVVDNGIAGSAAIYIDGVSGSSNRARGVSGRDRKRLQCFRRGDINR